VVEGDRQRHFGERLRVEDEMSEEDSGGRKESALRNKGVLLCHVWCGVVF
jgi:hypothetical protein